MDQMHLITKNMEGELEEEKICSLFLNISFEEDVVQDIIHKLKIMLVLKPKCGAQLWKKKTNINIIHTLHKKI